MCPAVGERSARPCGLLAALPTGELFASLLHAIHTHARTQLTVRLFCKASQDCRQTSCTHNNAEAKERSCRVELGAGLIQRSGSRPDPTGSPTRLLHRPSPVNTVHGLSSVQIKQGLCEPTPAALLPPPGAHGLSLFRWFRSPGGLWEPMLAPLGNETQVCSLAVPVMALVLSLPLRAEPVRTEAA